jgi:cytochrome P450
VSRSSVVDENRHSPILDQNIFSSFSNMLLLVLLAIALFFPIVQPILSYFRDSKHLRQFPSPSWAGLSSFWRIAHNLNGKHYLAIHKAHQELGTHVRIAPNHVSISDPAAMNEIYGHGANFLKDPWYDGGAGEHRSMGDTRVKAEHQQKRKMFAHVFAQKTIASLEHVVTDKVAVLVSEIDKKATRNETINIRRYVNYLAIDLISTLLYGQSLGCLERGDDIVDAQRRDGKMYKAPVIKSLHDSMVINTALGYEAPLLPFTKPLLAWHPNKKAGTHFDDIVYYNTMKRFASPDAPENDFFQKLMMNSKGEKLNLPLGEVLSECSVLMNAGSDPTTAALTGTIFLLFKHPRVLAKLRDELDPVLGDRDVPLYDDVANLPYLRACIEESLRFRPASSMGLPRVVPAGGRTIAGKFIDEGETVSVPTYTLLRDEVAFDKATEFYPDRWIEGDKERMLKARLPFSIGPRACIGRNIAYFEQIIIIATLVHAFDFELEHENFELETIERFNSNPGELVVSPRRRDVPAKLSVF